MAVEGAWLTERFWLAGGDVAHRTTLRAVQVL